MPTYEYACTECGHRVEMFQRIGDEPLSVCEVCGGPMRKVFHPAGIVFKGSGFYATDSRSGSKARDPKGDGKPSEAKETAKDSGSKDSKDAKASGGAAKNATKKEKTA